MTNPRMKRGPVRDRTQKLAGKSSVTQFPPLSHPRPGILGYRAPRAPGDICAAIMHALDREARLAKLTGVNTPPEVLSDMSEWIGRGCLP